MRVMVLIKADERSEAGVMPEAELLQAMGQYNEELVRAGVLLAGEGLKPSSQGCRVRLSGERRTLIPGPFAPSAGLVAGFWIWQVASLDDAVAWVSRMPNPMPGTEPEIEIRPVFETEDFAASDPDGSLRAQEQRLRAEVAGR